MIRQFVLAGMLVSFLSVASVVFAEDVFVTPNGTKYHKEICRLLKNKDSAVKLGKQEALEKDYSPCKRCYKENTESVEQQSKK